MKFLDYLFHGKELKAIGNYFKMLNGYSPTFTSFSGGVYEMDLTRTAINNFATHCSKLKPEIEGSALKSLEKTLQHKPNYFMDTTKFIKRLATYVAVEHSLPFNAVAVDGEYDRVYKAEDWAWYFATFIANGIFPKPSDGLQVVAYSGMEIRVNAGYAFINGYAFRNPATLSVTLDTAEGALNRVDRVVVRWDLPQRDMYIAVLKGTPSAKPTATAVTRTTEIWELALADIYVGKGVTRIQTQNITDQRFNSAVCGIVTGTVEEIDASVLTKQFTDFFNTYSAAVLDEFSAYKQSMEKYLTEIAGVYDSYVSKTEGLFAQYESRFNERYSSFESTLDNWDKELLNAYTDFMAKIKLFQSDAENEFNTWFESIKDKLGEDIAGSLQLQIEELAAAMQEVKKQAEAGTKETKEAIAALDERLKRVESGWGIDYKHDAVLGLCYMGAAYMSQHYERTVETAVLGVTYVGNSYLANTF